MQLNKCRMVAARLTEDLGRRAVVYWSDNRRMGEQKKLSRRLLLEILVKLTGFFELEGF
jgi:hypothetical protein